MTCCFISPESIFNSWQKTVCRRQKKQQIENGTKKHRTKLGSCEVWKKKTENQLSVSSWQKTEKNILHEVFRNYEVMKFGRRKQKTVGSEQKRE